MAKVFDCSIDNISLHHFDELLERIKTIRVSERMA